LLQSINAPERNKKPHEDFPRPPQFYLEGIRSAMGITREETLDANIAKLSVRYHQGKFTNRQAAKRADKVKS
jgi:hypothetical protein